MQQLGARSRLSSWRLSVYRVSVGDELATHEGSSMLHCLGREILRALGAGLAGSEQVAQHQFAAER
jgi:hypothetical protein